jgi:hypothetical protein
MGAGFGALLGLVIISIFHLLDRPDCETELGIKVEKLANLTQKIADIRATIPNNKEDYTADDISALKKLHRKETKQKELEAKIEILEMMV